MRREKMSIVKLLTIGSNGLKLFKQIIIFIDL